MKFKDFNIEKSNNSDNHVMRPLMKKAIETQAVDVRLYAESAPEKMNISVLQDNLGNCLDIIEDEVMKGYVTRLDRLPIIKFETMITTDLQQIHFFRISELVYQEDEFSVDKLTMVFHALSNRPCTLVLMLKSDGEKTDFYLGARPNGDNSAGTLFQMLKQSLLGFFPGSRITEYYDEDMKKDMSSLDIGCISSVTCIADYKQDQDSVSNKDFIQGLEKFVYTMQGKLYTAVFIADSVDHRELLSRKREYEQIYTQVSPFADMQLNFSVSDGGSTSTSDSEGTTKSASHTTSKGSSLTVTDGTTFTTGTSESLGTTETLSHTATESDSTAYGKTHTTGTSDGTSRTVTNGVNVGNYTGVSANGGIKIGSFNVGGGLNHGITAGVSHQVAKGTSHTDSVSDSVSKTLTHGFSKSKGYSHSDSRTIGKSENKSDSKSIGTATNSGEADTIGEAFNLVNTKTMTDTFGTSRSVTLNARNMTLSLALQQIEKHLDRIEECESFGMWNFAAYFLGETAAETETAANTYKSVIAGTDSGIERSAINSWTDEESVEDLASYIGNFVHPQFVYQGFSYDEERYIAVNPSALVSTNELAIHMALPRHSVRGLPVVEHAQFAQEVISRSDAGDRQFDLGKMYNLGQISNSDIRLDMNSLTMHTFITGSTGAGKSNTIYKILGELKRKGISFLIIESAKGEYKEIFGRHYDVQAYGTNPNMENIQMLRINPFRFPRHTHILEHLDRLIEIFNVCWPMYAAMPAILKDSVERAYVKCGWNLEKSTNKYDDEIFPTFSDVVMQIKTVLSESDYSDDNKGDYIGSLVTRLRSLTNGINGLIFTTDDIGDEQLFDRNSIVDLSRIGSSETKSLIMGLLVLKLQEHRMEQRSIGRNANEDLKHITVLEEAHNLLKRTSTAQSSESSNLIGKSVEMLANSIAEMRTYGEGFIIADQSPGMLDISVIRNTNTKIILRLPDIGDRELVGKAAGLNDSQITELTKLEKGVAAISQNDWLEPILCKVDKYKDFAGTDLPRAQKTEIDDSLDADEVSHLLLDAIMNKEIYCKGDKVDLQHLKDNVIRSKLATSVKCEFIDYLNSERGGMIKALRELVYDFFNAEEGIKASQDCNDISSWVHKVAENLDPSITTYSKRQIDLVMALLIYEQTLRDESYNNILCRFTEIYKSKGGVF